MGELVLVSTDLLEAVLAVLPLLVAAEAVVWRTDEWQSSGPQTTEVEALVPFGISEAEATPISPILSPLLHATTSGSFIFAVQVNPNLVNNSNVRAPCMQGALDEAMACPNYFGIIVT